GVDVHVPARTAGFGHRHSAIEQLLPLVVAARRIRKAFHSDAGIGRGEFRGDRERAVARPVVDQVDGQSLLAQLADAVRNEVLVVK
ncbi:MAG: hypothetical protein ACK559_10355, partial [bacterium]